MAFRTETENLKTVFAKDKWIKYRTQLENYSEIMGRTDRQIIDEEIPFQLVKEICEISKMTFYLNKNTIPLELTSWKPNNKEQVEELSAYETLLQFGDDYFTKALYQKILIEQSRNSNSFDLIILKKLLKTESEKRLHDKSITWINESILERWHDLHFFSNGYGITKYNGKYGIVNYNMEIIVPLKWESIKVIFDHDDKISNLAIAKKGEHRYYLIDYQTNNILLREYLNIWRHPHYNCIQTKHTHEHQDYNTLSFEGIEFTGEDAQNYLRTLTYYGNDRTIENMIFFKDIPRKEQNSKYALTTNNGESLTEFIFDNIECHSPIDSEFIHAKIGDKYFLMDTNGLVLLKNLKKSDIFLSKKINLELIWENILHFEHITRLQWKSNHFKVLIQGFWHILLPDFSISDVSWEAKKSDFKYEYYTNYRIQKGFPYIIKNTFQEAIIDEHGKFIKEWYFKGYEKMSNGLIVVRRYGLIGLFWEFGAKIDIKRHWIDVKDFNNQYIFAKLKKNEFVLIDKNGLEKSNPH